MRSLLLPWCCSLLALGAGLSACAQAAPSSPIDDPLLGASGSSPTSQGAGASAGMAGKPGSTGGGQGGAPGPTGQGGSGPQPAGQGGNGAAPAGQGAGQGGTDASSFGQGGSGASGPSGPSGGIPTTCTDAHDATGCCGSDGNLYYCKKPGTPTLKTCSSSCGWNTAKNYYDCNQSQSTDPGGSPRDCGGSSSGPGGGNPTGGGGVVPTTCAGAQGKVGCCAADTVYYCPASSGQVTSKSCSSGTCGWDPAKHGYGCSTQGQPDPSGANPIDCSGG